MKIEKYNYTGKVYNIEVEPNHEVKDDQFYINAENGVVIHNCHPRDNIALRSLAEQYNLGYDMFDAIMRAREVQAENLARFLIEQAEKHDLPIVIHGKAYKPNVPFVEGSYSTLIGYYLEELSDVEYWYADPLTGDAEVPPMKAVVLWAHNRGITYAYTGQSFEEPAYFDILEGSVIVDPWRRIEKDNDMYEIVWYGDTRE